jgi:hypothetical protein
VAGRLRRQTSSSGRRGRAGAAGTHLPVTRPGQTAQPRPGRQLASGEQCVTGCSRSGPGRASRVTGGWRHASPWRLGRARSVTSDPDHAIYIYICMYMYIYIYIPDRGYPLTLITAWCQQLAGTCELRVARRFPIAGSGGLDHSSRAHQGRADRFGARIIQFTQLLNEWSRPSTISPRLSSYCI